MLILNNNTVHKVIRFNANRTVTTEDGEFETDDCKILTLGLVKGLMVYVNEEQLDKLNEQAGRIPNWSNTFSWDTLVYKGHSRPFIVTGPVDGYPIGFYCTDHTNYPEVSFDDMMKILSCL